MNAIKSFLFENRGPGHTIAKNTFWLAASNIGGRVIRAVIVIYAARVLGTGAWGVFAYALGLVALITLLTDLGVGAVLTREASRTDETEQKRIISTAFAIKLAFLLASLFVLFVVLPPFVKPQEALALFPALGLVLIFDTIRDFGFSLIRAKERMQEEAGLFIITNIAIAAFGAWALVASPNILAFTAAYAAGTCVGTLATLYALRRDFLNTLTGVSRALVKPILSAAWPFAFAGVLGVAMTATDLFVIGLFRSTEELGLYGAADRLIQLLYLAPLVLSQGAFPTYSRLVRENKEKARGALERIIAASCAVAFPLSLAGPAIAGPLMGTLFGNEYLGAAVAFQVLLLTMVLRFPAALIGNALFAHGKERALLFSAIIGVNLNLILDVLLIPRFGIVGSACATVIAQLVVLVHLTRALARVEKISLLPRLKRIIPASILAALTAWGTAMAGMHFIPIVIGTSILYWALLALMKDPVLREARAILR